VLALQRTAGNRAASLVLRAGPSEPVEPARDEVMGKAEGEKSRMTKRKRSEPSTSEPRDRPRYRKEDPLSEGESESEDPNIGWRSIRAEEDPFTKGLRPPEDHDPGISAVAHVSAGSRAKVKSAWVSGSRSKKVAAAWGSESKSKLVVKFRVSPGVRAHKFEGRPGFFDLTDPDQAALLFPGGSGSVLNTAKASQEMLIHGGVPPSDVLALFEARKVSVTEFKRLKAELATGKEVFLDGKRLYAVVRTRTEVKKGRRPQPRVLLWVPNREPATGGQPPAPKE
jgi:hypothetical protein